MSMEELKRKKLESMKKKSKEQTAAAKKSYLKRKKKMQIAKEAHAKHMAEATPFVPCKSKNVHMGGRMRMRPNGDITKRLAMEAMMDMASQNVHEQLKKEHDGQTKEEITGEIKEAKSVDGDSQVSSP